MYKILHEYADAHFRVIAEGFNTRQEAVEWLIFLDKSCLADGVIYSTLCKIVEM